MTTQALLDDTARPVWLFDPFSGKPIRAGGLLDLVTPIASGFFSPVLTLGTPVTLAGIAGGTIPVGANGVLIQPDGCDIRLRLDGVAPTQTVGFCLTWEHARVVGPYRLIGSLGNIGITLSEAAFDPAACVQVQFIA